MTVSWDPHEKLMDVSSFSHETFSREEENLARLTRAMQVVSYVIFFPAAMSLYKSTH